jgi:hypothetical protein
MRRKKADRRHPMKQLATVALMLSFGVAAVEAHNPQERKTNHV